MADLTLQNVSLVAAGGALGAVTRFGIVSVLGKALGTGFPLGTLFVNVAGCAVAGLVLSGEQEGRPVPESTRSFIVVGFLGAFTTFSAFSAETMALHRKGESVAAAGNVALNVALCLAGFASGWAVGRWLRG
ncbi:MAG: fluoride efflux transporter CrcB [Phycisphaerales bacterium]|nr:fluoride efflux transporter CrcB [Phycisphaerales bacterium]